MKKKLLRTVDEAVAVSASLYAGIGSIASTVTVE
jgi:hypothetical protein